MAFTEDIDTFFGDFSENVFYDNATYKGILEQPDEIVADDRVLTTDYQLTVKTVDLGSLAYDTQIEVSNVKYKVRSCLLYTSPSPRDVEESRMPSSA